MAERDTWERQPRRPHGCCTTGHACVPGGNGETGSGTPGNGAGKTCHGRTRGRREPLPAEGDPPESLPHPGPASRPGCASTGPGLRPPAPELLGPVLRELRADVAERLHHGRGALHVRVVYHDVPCGGQGQGVSGTSPPAAAVQAKAWGQTTDPPSRRGHRVGGGTHQGAWRPHNCGPARPGGCTEQSCPAPRNHHPGRAWQ